MEALQAQQNRLQQLEKEDEHQREAKKDLRRETRRRQELKDKLLKLEADLKTETARSSHEDSPHNDQDPFTKEIMKAKGIKGLQSSQHDSVRRHIRSKLSS